MIALNGLSPLEVASHVLTGSDPAAQPPPRSRRTAIAALEESLRLALSTPPCMVAFSGGRDSSALLAVAARVARREGLPGPIPVTLRFAGAPETDEEDWQSLVIAQLGAPDWVRLDFDDELDLVGPVARGLMERDGLPYPYNLHLLVPLIEAAEGGTLVTGLGGDQALQPAGRALDVLARRVRPAPRDVLRVGAAAGPHAVRRLALRRRPALSFPWLTAEANTRLGRAWLEEEVRRPFRWNALLCEEWRSRYMQLTVRRLDAVGRAIGASVRHPFAEPEFISALASEAGATGFASRTAAMDFLFADALPRELIGRPTKALFDDVLWNRHTRGFLDGLDEAALGRGLASLGLDRIVDPRALCAHWSGPNPLANSFLLLQACWLTMHARPAVAHDGERHPEPQPGCAA